MSVWYEQSKRLTRRLQLNERALAAESLRDKQPEALYAMLESRNELEDALALPLVLLTG